MTGNDYGNSIDGGDNEDFNNNFIDEVKEGGESELERGTDDVML